MKVYVVVYRDGGLIEDVEVFASQKEADERAAASSPDEHEGYGRYADVFESEVVRKKER